MHVAGVLMAVGGGRRLGGVPLVVHAAAALRDSLVVDLLVVVAPPGGESEIRRMLDSHLPGVAVVVDGAASRHASLHRGLSAVDSSARTLVLHDARRPLAPPELVVRVVEAVHRNADLAVPVLEVTETVKELDPAGRIVRTVPRETLVRMQMPRAVRRAVTDAAHLACPTAGVDGPDDGPDDDGRLAGVGARVVTVEGSGDAFPVVGEMDLAVAEAVLAAR